MVATGTDQGVALGADHFCTRVSQVKPKFFVRHGSGSGRHNGSTPLQLRHGRGLFGSFPAKEGGYFQFLVPIQLFGFRFRFGLILCSSLSGHHQAPRCAGSGPTNLTQKRSVLSSWRIILRLEEQLRQPTRKALKYGGNYGVHSEPWEQS